MVERLAELLAGNTLDLMVPPESFSTAAAQSSSDFCRGCEDGTQCEIFRSKVFSCANAGVTPAASSSANNAFLMDILSLGHDRPFCARPC